MAAEKIGKVDEMEKLLRQVIAQNAEYYNAYNALGFSLADRNVRLQEAKELIVKALSFAPEDPFITDSLGWVEFRMGNFEAALASLQSMRPMREAEVAFARQQVDRNRTLLQAGAVSQREVEQFETQLRTADAQLKALDEQLRPL